MSNTSSAKRLKLSTYKLNTILDITQAINQSRSTDLLLNKFEKVLREDLEIDRVLFYKYESSWECMLASGVDEEVPDEIDVANDLMPFEEITFISATSNKHLELFDILIPIIQDNKPIAYILTGDNDDETKGVSPSIKHLNFVQTLSIIIIVAIENIRLFKESVKQEAFKKELELASKMQYMLIPSRKILPRTKTLFVDSFYHPHFEVGGDYYDFIQLNEKEFGFCIADVSGKGISAALLMSNFQANLRAMFTSEIILKKLILKLNERVIAAAKGEKFITLFIGRYNTESRELEYINAGHNPPLLYDINEDKVDYLVNGCVGLGMLDFIPTIKIGLISINPNSKILCYTDGLVEVLNDHNGVDVETTLLVDSLKNDQRIDLNIANIITKQNFLKDSDNIFDDISMLGLHLF